jgi:hypothetical protein
MDYKSKQPNKQTWDYEVCDLNNRKPADLVRKLYQELPEGDEYIRGFKCPGHFSREPLRNIRRYFGRAKLIVGLRHPVRWFERYDVLHNMLTLCLTAANSMPFSVFSLTQCSCFVSAFFFFFTYNSYFNFRIRHPRGGVMPTPDQLIGKCVHESQGVCTDRANFHRVRTYGTTLITGAIR